jgi:hypothetical protein
MDTEKSLSALSTDLLNTEFESLENQGLLEPEIEEGIKPSSVSETRVSRSYLPHYPRE